MADYRPGRWGGDGPGGNTRISCGALWLTIGVHITPDLKLLQHLSSHTGLLSSP